MEKRKNDNKDNRNAAYLLIGIGLLVLLVPNLIGLLFELVFGAIGLVFGVIGGAIGIVVGGIGAVIGLIMGTFGAVIGLFFGAIMIWLPLLLMFMGARMLLRSRPSQAKRKNDVYHV